MKLTIRHIQIMQRLKNPEDLCIDISHDALEFLQNKGMIRFIYADDGNGLIWRTITEQGELLLAQNDDITKSLIDGIKTRDNKTYYLASKKIKEKSSIVKYHIIIPILVTIIGGIILAYILKKFGLN